MDESRVFNKSEIEWMYFIKFYGTSNPENKTS